MINANTRAVTRLPTCHARIRIVAEDELVTLLHKPLNVPQPAEVSSCRSLKTPSNLSKMSDLDVFAAMGIAGFGKSSKKKQLDPTRFDKNKRAEVGLLHDEVDSRLTSIAALGPGSPRVRSGP